MKSSFTKIFCAFLGILTAGVNSEYTVSKRICLYSGYSTYALSNSSTQPGKQGAAVTSRDCEIIATHFHAATYIPPADRYPIASPIGAVQGITCDSHTFTQKKIPSSISFSPLTPQLTHGRSLLLFINNLTI